MYAYANQNPVHYIDPDGHFAFIAVIGIVAGGYAVLSGVDLATQRYYQYKQAKLLDREIQFTRKLLAETDSQDCERYKLLKRRLEELTLQQASLFASAGVEIVRDSYTRAPDFISNK